MSDKTTEEVLIDAAHKHAESYEGDDRQDIATDVMNAFYAGSAFAEAIRQQEHDKLMDEVAMLREAVSANHEWHKLMDEHGGYEDSELCGHNNAALSSTTSADEWLVEQKAKVLEDAMNTCYGYDCSHFSNVSLAEVACVELGDILSTKADKLRGE